MRGLAHLPEDEAARRGGAVLAWAAQADTLALRRRLFGAVDFARR